MNLSCKCVKDYKEIANNAFYKNGDVYKYKIDKIIGWAKNGYSPVTYTYLINMSNEKRCRITESEFEEYFIDLSELRNEKINILLKEL